MERQWLATQLEAGRSIEAIARAVGKHPSTVAYWVNKHGLASVHAPRARARGGVGEAELKAMVERGMSIREIATAVELSATSVRHWLKRYGLKTAPRHYAAANGPKPDHVLRECRTHGWVPHPRGSGGFYRCAPCSAERVTRHRRRLKATLIAEAGGACVMCGYKRSQAALQFHHLDPGQKSFHISLGGVTRSIDALRAEAAKCVLLCANCHAEVEVGDATLPAASPGNPG